MLPIGNGRGQCPAYRNVARPHAFGARKWGMVDQSEESRALARKCRRLASAINDEPTREALESLASQYEEQARAQVVAESQPGPAIPKG